MTYHLTPLGVGIAIDRAPVPAVGLISVTLRGEFADALFVGGRFYPIVGGVCELPAEAVTATTPVTAHALSARRRYVCDPLGRLGDGGALIAPLPSSCEETAVRLSEALGEATRRLDAMEETLRELGAMIRKTPFTIGGTV
ncbi:MAG: hypothetical protein J6V07_03585 [Clostridia bacterium]|nr:hypothetical protein [Clostridia bacterium]